MNETNELNQELIPGTNIPRPRNREVTETDQQYVEYLKAYYEQYFPEPIQEQTVETIPVVENINNQTDDVIMNEELDNIRDNLESYADQIIEQQKPIESEVVTPEPTLFEVNSENNTVQETIGFDTSIDTPVDNNIQQEVVESNIMPTQSESVVEPSISFDISAEENTDNLAPFDITVTNEEVASYTHSNPTLNSNIRKPGFFNNILAFFKRKRTNMDELVSKAEEYLEDISTSLEKDSLIPAVGRAR